MHTTRTRTVMFLHLPDGRQLEPSAPGVRRYFYPGDQCPRYEIDGQRFRVDYTAEFPHVPWEPDGDGGVIYTLIALEPPPN